MPFWSFKMSSNDVQDSSFEQPLFKCIMEGSLDEVNYLLKDSKVAPVIVNQGDLDDLTPLHLAVELNREDIVQVLIDSGSQINRQTIDLKLSPLHLAVRNGSTSMADLLLSHGADINLKNKIDHSPLHVAITMNHIEMVRLLLFWGADPDVITNDRRRETPLIKAATISLPLTKLLIESGAKLSHELKEVHVSILANKPEISLMILNHVLKTKEQNQKIKSQNKSSAKIKDQYLDQDYELKPNRIGKSHLQSVTSHVTNCDPKMAVELMSKLILLGDDVNYSNHFGSLFHILISRGDQDEVARSCFDYLIHLDNIDCDQKISIGGSNLTPISMALKMNQFYFGEQLLKFGFIDVNKVNIESFKFTPGSITCLRMLKNLGFKFPPTFSDHNRPSSSGHDSSFVDFCCFLQDDQNHVSSLRSQLRIYLRRTFKKQTPKVLSKMPLFVQNFVLEELE